MAKTTKLGTYIDPLSDFGFKLFFEQQTHKDILISFLNEILRGRKEIADIKFGPNEHQETDGHRGVVVDLYCIGPDKEQFVVEMQRAGLEFFKDRSLFYTSRIISLLEKKGKENWNYELPHVFFIGIMDFRFHKEQQ